MTTFPRRSAWALTLLLLASSCSAEYASPSNTMYRLPFVRLEEKPRDRQVGRISLDENDFYHTSRPITSIPFSKSLTLKVSKEDGCGRSSNSCASTCVPRGGSNADDDVKVASDSQNRQQLQPQQQPQPSGTTTWSYSISKHSVRGARPYMEDEHIHSKAGRFAAVFDGHGGNRVSRYLRQNLYANLQAALPAAAAAEAREIAAAKESAEEHAESARSTAVDNKDRSVRPKSTPSGPSVEACIRALEAPSVGACVRALQTAFDKVDSEVQRISHWSFQGSTAVAVLFHENHVDGKRTLISANVGDSRAVLSRRGRAMQLTRDHKPDDPIERERIEASGGTVDWCGMVDENGKPIEETGVYRINGNLAVARAIGDRSEQPCVSSEVEIRTLDMDMDVDGGDEFVLLASDGLWDVMSNEDVVGFVNNELQNRCREGGKEERVKAYMAKMVVGEALRRGTTDNVSVVIIWLK